MKANQQAKSGGEGPHMPPKGPDTCFLGFTAHLPHSRLGSLGQSEQEATRMFRTWSTHRKEEVLWDLLLQPLAKQLNFRV